MLPRWLKLGVVAVLMGVLYGWLLARDAAMLGVSEMAFLFIVSSVSMLLGVNEFRVRRCGSPLVAISTDIIEMNLILSLLVPGIRENVYWKLFDILTTYVIAPFLYGWITAVMVTMILEGRDALFDCNTIREGVH